MFIKKGDFWPPIVCMRVCVPVNVCVCVFMCVCTRNEDASIVIPTNLFWCVLATLYEGVSVRWSVCLSARRSIGPLVRWSVSHTFVKMTILTIFWALLPLPNRMRLWGRVFVGQSKCAKDLKTAHLNRSTFFIFF